MTRKLSSAIGAASGLVWGIAVLSAAPPQLITEFRVDTITTSPPRQTSPVFLSDNLLCLLVLAGSSLSPEPIVMVLRLVDEKLEKTAITEVPKDADHLFAVSDRRILVHGQRGLTLYSQDLRDQWSFPIHQRLSARFPQARVAGLRDGSGWALLQLGPDMHVLRTGTGELLSVSNEALVRRQGETLQMEGLDGHSLGAIKAPSAGRGIVAEIAGTNRLLLDFGGSPRIVDFHGKVLLQFSEPPGWGFQHGWSSDGRRVLFDRFTRTASVAERTLDSLASIVVPVPEESNGELIVVVDAVTGRTCFQLHAPNGKHFGSEGQMNSDISPDGRLVAVAALDRISIYRLPETCDVQ